MQIKRAILKRKPDFVSGCEVRVTLKPAMNHCVNIWNETSKGWGPHPGSRWSSWWQCPLGDGLAHRFTWTHSLLLFQQFLFALWFNIFLLQCSGPWQMGMKRCGLRTFSNTQHNNRGRTHTLFHVSSLTPTFPFSSGFMSVPMMHHLHPYYESWRGEYKQAVINLI